MKVALLALLFATACGGGNKAHPDAGAPDAGIGGFHGPDDVCPGAAHCTGTAGDGKLYVGVAKQTINPTITETWTDTNGNSQWDTGEPFVDANGNGKFDGTWIAGFGTGRAANGIDDDIEARAIALRYNDVTYVICVLDVIGFLGDDLTQIATDGAAGLDVDHVQVSSTHTHESVDTIGIWGSDPLATGLNPAYMQHVHDQAVKAIRDAVADLKPANMTVAQDLVLDDPTDPTSGTDEWNHDIRDPVIYDPTMTVIQFTEEADPTKTIGTIVNWASHPEYGGDENLMISADYPHWLRDVVEQGIPAESLPGLGGECVFVQGPLGGQVGALHGVMVPDPPNPPIDSLGLAKSAAVGTNLGRKALAILADKGMPATDHAISYRTAEVDARVDNIGFQTYFLLHILPPTPLLGYDPTQAIEGSNIPWIPLRITYLQIGPVATITAPGELHPELWVGGYDGSWSWGYPILSPAVTENVPDLATAPQPPYLRDLVKANPGVQYVFLTGLAESYVGYIVPKYNYVLDANSPYIAEAAGQHYEETRSLGPDEEEQLVWPMLELAKWRPGN